MEAILKEQGFRKTGCVSTDCAVEVGQMVGVKAMAAGSIGKLEDLYLVSARLISVETGLMVHTSSVEVRGSLTQVLKQALPLLASKLSARETTPQEGIPPPIPQQSKPPERARRRAQWILGAGIGSVPTSSGLRLDSVIVTLDVGPSYTSRIGRTQSWSGPCFGLTLQGGMLLSRSYVGAAIWYCGTEGASESFRFSTSVIGPHFSRQFVGGAIIWYYEPTRLRNRPLCISPGLSVGLLTVLDRVLLIAERYDSRYDIFSKKFGAPLVKLRAGRRRVVTTLEYGFTSGKTLQRAGLEAYTEQTVSSPRTQWFFSYDGKNASFIDLTIMVALGRQATWAQSK